MKNYFLILAALCCVLFTGCKKEDGFGSSGNEDKTEQKPGNNGDNSDDQNEESSKIPENMELAFPDPLFRAYVLENFDTDGDGKISEEEAEAVTKIDVEYKNINSLDGIQYFTNLTYLNCTYNKIASLDVRKNTKLTTLYCNYNKLTTLDVSGCSALTYLYCYGNQLATLDVSKNTALTFLDCTYNQLTTLDVSKNTELYWLYCYSNQLTTLDVSKNTALIDLRCYSNKLTTLDVSKNTKLTFLCCYSNQIEELDLSKTNLMNSTFNNSVDSYTYPLDCSPMNTLKKVYLKKGWSIKYITEDNGRSSDRIPDHTEIIFVD